MTRQLQQIYQDLNEISAVECLQVIEHLVNRLKGSSLSDGTPKAIPQPYLSAQEVFTLTQGSWGNRSLDEIDAKLAEQREFDWSV